MRTPILVAAACLTLALGLAMSAPAYADGWRHKGFGHGHGHFNKRPHKVFIHRHDHGDKLLAAVGILAGAHVISSYLESTRPAAPNVVYAAPPPVYVAPRQCYQTYVGYPQPYGGIAWVPQVQCY